MKRLHAVAQCFRKVSNSSGNSGAFRKRPKHLESIGRWRISGGTFSAVKRRWASSMEIRWELSSRIMLLMMGAKSEVNNVRCYRTLGIRWCHQDSLLEETNPAQRQQHCSRLVDISSEWIVRYFFINLWSFSRSAGVDVHEMGYFIGFKTARHPKVDDPIFDWKVELQKSCMSPVLIFNTKYIH